jgi:hypothetical protein
MPSDVSEVQSEILREQIVPAFVAMLDDAPPLDDPAALEQLAATLPVPLEQPEMPEEAASAVAEEHAAERRTRWRPERAAGEVLDGRARP